MAKHPDFFEKELFKNLASDIAELKDDSKKFRKEVRDKMSRILTQTTKTNGRVTNAEKEIKVIKESLGKKKSIIGDRLSGKTVWMVLAIILALVYIVANQTNTDLPKEILSGQN